MPVSASEYFDQQTRKRGIKREWCEAIVLNPVATELQPDGRTRYWGYSEEAKHYIRVVIETNGELLNAFFDHNFDRRRRR
jgi:hypothetical protein